MENKAYFFCMTVTHYRTGAEVGKRCGVVFAASQNDAEQIAWDKYGNDYTCRLWVEEVSKEGYCADLR